MGINKVVVGSGCGDVPKYTGEGVVLRRTPGTLGVPWLRFSYSMAIFGNFLWARLGHAASEAHHLIFGCYIINGCCDFICDVTVPHMHQSRDLLL